ncbi:MAG: hypothetical protein Q9227_004217 [Pyrenula ochraceoflavens]
MATTMERTLDPRGSENKYNIHKGLLENLAPTIASSKGFKEGSENHYIFEDTAEATVSKFILWAYSNKYPRLESSDSGDNPFIADAQLYIFAEIYLIEALKHSAMKHLTKSIELLAKGGNMKNNPARPNKLSAPEKAWLIELLKLCFEGSLRDDDRLLYWLGRLTAWLVDEFRAEPAFLAILPAMSPFMLRVMRRADLSPWNMDDVDILDEEIHMCSSCERECTCREGNCIQCGEFYKTEDHDGCHDVRKNHNCSHCGRNHEM